MEDKELDMKVRAQEPYAHYDDVHDDHDEEILHKDQVRPILQGLELGKVLAILQVLEKVLAILLGLGQVRNLLVLALAILRVQVLGQIHLELVQANLLEQELANHQGLEQVKVLPNLQELELEMEQASLQELVQEQNLQELEQILQCLHLPMRRQALVQSELQ